MRLAGIVEPDVGICDETGPTCTISSGGSFTLAVELVSVPVTGYVLAQSYTDFGNNLFYDVDVRTAAEEIVWPDCDEAIAIRARRDGTLPRKSISSEVVSHGCATGLFPPQPVSTYVGPFVEISLECSMVESSSEIWLRPDGHPMAGGNGARYISVGESGNLDVIPEVGSLTVNCLAAQTATPTPTTMNTPTSTTEPVSVETLTPTATATEPPATTPTATPTPTLDSNAPPTWTPEPTWTLEQAPTETQTPTPLDTPQLQSGDANCDGSVDPLDAAFILQLVARLISGLPCPDGGDASGDGVVDATDAALILQLNAGLIDALPA